jgi:hypothetical protein
MAIILDVISQYLIFHNVHPAAALLLGSVLIGVPYAASKGLANRIVRRAPGLKLVKLLIRAGPDRLWRPIHQPATSLPVKQTTRDFAD